MTVSKTVDRPPRISCMTRKLLFFMLVAGTAASISAGTESFDRIKKQLSSAGCTSLEFISIIESDIFSSVDSTEGRGIIADDGRYRIELGGDVYLSTGELLYSYSENHNQVTVGYLGPDAEAAPEVSFLTRLDEFFETTIIRAGREYLLIQKSDDVSGLPDSLRVYLDSTEEQIERLEYYDINEELNRIIIEDLATDTACDTSHFMPDFPDTVEVIELF